MYDNSNISNHLSALLNTIKSELSIVDEIKGTTAISLSGTERCLKVPIYQLSRDLNKEISHNLDTFAFSDFSLAEKPTLHGFNPFAFFQENGVAAQIPDIAFGIIANHYATKLGKDYTDHCQMVATALIASGARKLFRQVLGWKQDRQINSIEEQLKVAKFIGNEIEAKFNNSGIGKQLALKIYSIVAPNKFLPILEEAKMLLAEANAVDSKNLYTATNIFHELVERGFVQYNTARKVNNLLEKLGLQTKPKKNWIATNKAKNLDLCSEMEITASFKQKDNKWVGKQLRWKQPVINYIAAELEDNINIAS